jgi:hypothetical protein
MKAHIYLSIALLTATCCCFSSFCADTTQKPLNWKAREALEREYTELDTQKKNDPIALDRKYKIATQMRERYEQLVQQQPHNEHAQSRKEHAERWREKEKKSGDELDKLKEYVKQNLNQVKLTSFNQRKNDTQLSPEQSAELLKLEHDAVHKLKEIYQKETKENPQDKTAQMLAQEYMLHSALLSQVQALESRQQLQQQTTLKTPQTPNASEPMSTVTTPTSSFAPNGATADRLMATTTVVTSVTPPLTEVKVETPTSSFAKATADVTTDKPTEIKTEQQTDEQKKDKNCIIL